MIGNIDDEPKLGCDIIFKEDDSVNVLNHLREWGDLIEKQKKPKEDEWVK